MKQVFHVLGVAVILVLPACTKPEVVPREKTAKTSKTDNYGLPDVIITGHTNGDGGSGGGGLPGGGHGGGGGLGGPTGHSDPGGGGGGGSTPSADPIFSESTDVSESAPVEDGANYSRLAKVGYGTGKTLNVVVQVNTNTHEVVKATPTMVGLGVGYSLAQVGGATTLSYNPATNVYRFDIYFQIILNAQSHGNIGYCPVQRVSGTINATTHETTLIIYGSGPC